MKESEDSGKSFIKHMVGNGKGLRAYANLIYAGLAAVPGSVGSREEFLADLLPYVSRCEACDDPLKPLEWGEDCEGCRSLYYETRLATMKALDKHRNTGFCCMELDGLPYRRRRGQYREELSEGDAA